MMTKTRKLTVAALALAGGLAAQSALACQAPAAPRSLPDGRSADMLVMQDAKHAVEQYVEKVADYFQCEKDALKLQQVSEEQRAVLSRFNAEARVFVSMNRIATARRVGLTQR